MVVEKVNYANQVEKKNLRREKWMVNASIVAKNTFNPIRDLLETMTITPNPDKKMISLSIGDPTVFGNLLPAQEVVDAVHAALDSQKCNG
jgi:tyrosine aminotransferase